MKNFIFNWHRNEKYSKPINRNVKIQSADAKSATEVFMKTFGNLKKNTINYIQEIDENHQPIGEKIIPN